MEKLKVGVIFGGRSGEHEVSLMSARSVINALDTEKYEITQIGINHEGAWFIGDDILDIMSNQKDGTLTPVIIYPDPNRKGLYTIIQQHDICIHEKITELDVIFSVLHGPFGEDGTIQGIFEMSGLAYVGSGVLGSSLGMDKGVFRDVMRANGIPSVQTLVVDRSEIEEAIDEVIKRGESLSPYPLFTKPANLGSSVGISKCHNRSDLLEGLMDAARFDRRVLIEHGINAREIEVSILGNENPVASVPGEIVPAAEFYTYDAKYYDERSKLIIPAPIPFETSEEVRNLAIRAYRAIDCAGLARVDFLLDRDNGKLFLSEINTLPGFTKISMYPKLWEASGLSYRELVDKLIELALDRKAQRDLTEWRYTR
ncbi:MAG: D-alanine--D-alanine ligase [Anaerolineales bacterium]|nr:D-alanine--D-alanine ligase [Anaerolineales bacterium]